MRLKEICQRTGLSRDTIRFYEEQGLFKPLRVSYARDYQDKDIERLLQIIHLKKLGFSLKEIKLLTDFDDNYQDLESILQMKADDKRQLLELLDYKIQDINKQLEVLEEGKLKLDYMYQKMKNIPDA